MMSLSFTRVAAAVVAAGLAACARPAPVSPGAIDAGSTATGGCARTSVGLTPLTDLVSGFYLGQPGGLYPGRRNDAPTEHLATGLAMARALQPLDSSGRPDPAGRFAFIAIGMSNTTQEFSAFVPMAHADASKHPRLSVVDGAQGGMTAVDWSTPSCACWAVLGQRLQQAGISAAQVTTAWIKLADARPTAAFPSHARALKDETVATLRILKTRFPNLALAYLSSRIYAGYATTPLNPEPFAYESAFAVRWVIEDQIGGALVFSGPGAEFPWVAWGPYLWADGLNRRSDGMTWACADLQADGTHPSGSGRQKVAEALAAFVRNDATAREWYAR